MFFFQILKYCLTYTITYFLTLRRITDIKCEFCNRSPINYDVILKFKVEPNTTLKANPRDESYPKLSISDARKLKTLSRWAIYTLPHLIRTHSFNKIKGLEQLVHQKSYTCGLCSINTLD